MVAVLVALTAGCAVGAEDDEMVTQRRTVTASPSPAVTGAPRSLPVGEGPVSARAVVWSQGSRLHVGRRSVDVSPLGIDAFVVVAGGIYLLDDGDLRFTDLSRVRGTGLAEVTGLDVAPDRSRMRVTTKMTGTESAYTYETRGGRLVDGDGYTAQSGSDRLGTRSTLRVPGTGALTVRNGPGRYAVGLDGQGTPVAVDTVTRSRIPLRGAVPTGLQLAGWAGAGTFYGEGGTGGGGTGEGGTRATSVVSCDVVDRVCTDLGRTAGTGPVVFGTGAWRIDTSLRAVPPCDGVASRLG